MNPRERQAWIIAASVFVTLFLVWGGVVNTGPVFLPPLLKYFGWTRARVSTPGSAGALMAGASGPLVGWLVDRIEARRVMLLGVLHVRSLRGAVRRGRSSATHINPHLLFEHRHMARVRVGHERRGERIVADFLRYTVGMAKKSAGLVMYRVRNNQLEVLLVHLGGPFWAKKDEGAWFIPKGEVGPAEDEFTAAKREFQEETGIEPYGAFIALGSVKHKGGKIVRAWAFEGDCDPTSISSNTFTIEWPPRSGNKQAFPEIDRAQFVSVEQARAKIYAGEFNFIDRLEKICIEGAIPPGA